MIERWAKLRRMIEEPKKKKEEEEGKISYGFFYVCVCVCVCVCFNPSIHVNLFILNL